MLHNIALITTWRCDLTCLHCLQGYPAERADFPIELLPKLLKDASRMNSLREMGFWFVTFSSRSKKS